MTKSWDDMTYNQKLEALTRAVQEMHATQIKSISDQNETWEALRALRLEIGKIAKDVATLRSLWPKNYSRAG